MNHMATPFLGFFLSWLNCSFVLVTSYGKIIEMESNHSSCFLTHLFVQLDFLPLLGGMQRSQFHLKKDMTKCKKDW